jgi:hypothetical protein
MTNIAAPLAESAVSATRGRRMCAMAGNRSVADEVIE